MAGLLNMCPSMVALRAEASTIEAGKTDINTRFAVLARL